MTRTRRLITALTVALAVTVPAAPAAAQGSGVTIDPGSPSGKEYAIPLEEARREATLGGSDLKSTQQGERSAPLFGEGVGDGGGGGPAGSGDAGRAQPTGGKQAGSRIGKAGSRRGGDQPAATEAGSVDDVLANARTIPVADDGNSVVTIGALALSVLILGAALGSIARRRRS